MGWRQRLLFVFPVQPTSREEALPRLSVPEQWSSCRVGAEPFCNWDPEPAGGSDEHRFMKLCSCWSCCGFLFFTRGDSLKKRNFCSVLWVLKTLSFKTSSWFFSTFRGCNFNDKTFWNMGLLIYDLDHGDTQISFCAQLWLILISMSRFFFLFCDDFVLLWFQFWMVELVFTQQVRHVKAGEQRKHLQMDQIVVLLFNFKPCSFQLQ